MCGNYATKGSATWREFRKQIAPEWPTPENARYNIRPTDPAPLVRLDMDGYRLDDAQWWLIPASSNGTPNRKYPMFNARCETLLERRSYREPFMRQRGLMPMSAFVERSKAPDTAGYWSVTSELEGMAAAALWEVWGSDDQAILSCTMITTAAAPEFEPWHHRMPVLLTADEWPRWLDNSVQIAPDDPLFKPALKYPLVLSPLDSAIGNVKNKSPDTMKPVGPVQVIK